VKTIVDINFSCVLVEVDTYDAAIVTITLNALKQRYDFLLAEDNAGFELFTLLALAAIPPPTLINGTAPPLYHS